MFDKAKLLVENQLLKSKLGKLEKELADLIHDIERYVSISSSLATENEELRDSLKDARDSLTYFKTWGELLNQVIGHNSTAESWRPALAALARIDAKLAEK